MRARSFRDKEDRGEQAPCPKRMIQDTEWISHVGAGKGFGLAIVFRDSLAAWFSRDGFPMGRRRVSASGG